MTTKRKRNKKYSVTVTHEDFMRMNRADLGLEPGEVEAVAILFAALRNLHCVMGPEGGQRAFDVIANSLPPLYAENWTRARPSASEEGRLISASEVGQGRPRMMVRADLPTAHSDHVLAAEWVA